MLKSQVMVTSFKDYLLITNRGLVDGLRQNVRLEHERFERRCTRALCAVYHQFLSNAHCKDKTCGRDTGNDHKSNGIPRMRKCVG